MSKRANPMAVKSVLTYDVSEAAKALGKSSATIRNWVKDGLPVMSSKKPLLISGLALREYLRAKYRDQKSPLASDELYCPSCRKGRRPVAMAVEVCSNSPKTTRLLGTCSHCDAYASRIISKSKADAFAQTFLVKEGGQSET
ncbi:helix-turn-helix domain-containing protein [Roseobacter sp. EG26]|uniref:helix-turn-helix domain-containing protein n=1 Tax=Roseobacter sp. EG26 TaxID=3412477 RepID=UPI003CE59CE7